MFGEELGVEIDTRTVLFRGDGAREKVGIAGDGGQAPVGSMFMGVEAADPVERPGREVRPGMTHAVVHRGLVPDVLESLALGQAGIPFLRCHPVFCGGENRVIGQRFVEMKAVGAGHEAEVDADVFAFTGIVRVPAPVAVKGKDDVSTIPQAGSDVYFFVNRQRDRGFPPVDVGIGIGRHLLAAEADGRRQRPGFEIVGDEGLHGPSASGAAVPVYHVVAVDLREAAELVERADGVLLEHRPGQAVGAEGYGELARVARQFERHLEPARGIGVVGFVEDEGGEDLLAVFDAVDFDPVVLRAAAVRDEAEVGPGPVAAVGAGGITDVEVVGAAFFALAVAEAEVPHAVFVAHADDGAVELDAVVIGAAGRTGSQHRRLPGGSFQVHPEAPHEGDGPGVEGKENGFRNNRRGRTGVDLEGGGVHNRSVTTQVAPPCRYH